MPRRESDFEIAVLAANRIIDRKIEIEAVPAISPYNRFGVKTCVYGSLPAVEASWGSGIRSRCLAQMVFTDRGGNSALGKWVMREYGAHEEWEE